MILLYLVYDHGYVHHMASVPEDFDFRAWWTMLWEHGLIPEGVTRLEWEPVERYEESDPDKLMGSDEAKRDYLRDAWEGPGDGSGVCPIQPPSTLETS